MYTNQMRMTGLSGIDTESMIKQLMKAESMKLVNIRKSREINVWKQEQYRDVAKTLSTFKKNFLTFSANTNATNLKSESNFKSLTSLIKIAGTDTPSTAISLSTTNAKAGSYKLKVDQLASKDIWTGTKSVGGSVRSSGPIDINSIKSGDSFDVYLDGKKTSISFDDADISEIQDQASFVALFNRKLKAAGTETINGTLTNKVSASIDADGRLNITAGPGHTASITNGSRTTNTVDAANALATGTDRTIDFDVQIDGVTTTISVDVDAADDENAIAAAINNKLKEENVNGVSVKVKDGKLSFVNTNSSKKVEISGADLTSLGFDSSVSSVTLDKSSVFSDLGFDAGSSTSLNLKSSLGKVFDITGSGTFTINGKEIAYDSTDTVETILSRINNSDTKVKMSYDTLKGTFTLESTDLGAKNAVTFSDPNDFLKDAFGFENTQSAKDAVITLNGVSTTRETNSFTIEGLNIKLTSEAEGKEFSIDISEDNTKTLDFIKKFVDEYNNLVDSLRSVYNTARPKSDKYSYYEPLTEEEKEALSDRELEKYEAKAKEGLLYRDPIVSGIASSMRSMLYEAVDLGDGRKISLYEIGITTTRFPSNDGGKIEIDEAKLTKAIEEIGDDIVGLFTKMSDVSYSKKANRNERRRTEGIAYRLEDIINDAIGSNGSIYNKAGILETSSVTENDLYKVITAQDQKITDMLAMLAKKENNYYLMFSKLETAMTQANSQMASLQSMLGL